MSTIGALIYADWYADRHLCFKRKSQNSKVKT